MFLKLKEETLSVFEDFAKKVQVKCNEMIARIRSDYGTKFKNAKFLEFYSIIGIDHNFSARRTPQQI